MARPLRIQYPDALYHLTNRGNERRAIFQDDEDRREFLRILSQSLATYTVILHCFVLMKNHWHFLARTPLGNLAEFMRHFNITYTSYYNRRHNRAGHLYQGRYKSFLVEKDAYLTMVSRYIHLNPVKVAGFRQKKDEDKLGYLWKYRWSSLPGYIDRGRKLDFIDYETVLGEYGGDTPAGRQRYREQIAKDLEAGLDIRKRIVGQSILGSSDFVSQIKEKYLAVEKAGEQPAISRIHRYLSREEVLEIVAKETGVENVLFAGGTVRQTVMTMLYKFAGLNNRQIGEMLGLDYSTVSQGRKRLGEKVEKDPVVRELVQRIERYCQK